MISTPVPLWPISYAPSGGTPTVGIRASIYSSSSVPSEFRVPMLWNADATTANQRMLIQYRVTSEESTPSVALFDVDGYGCDTLLIPTNDAVIATAADNVTDDNITAFAGGFLTCDWGSYNVIVLNADMQLRHTPFSVDFPTLFDAFDSFDVLIWAQNTSAMLSAPTPTYNYLLWTPMVSNNTSVDGAIVSNSSSGYDSSSVDVSTYEREWYLEDTTTTYVTAAVTPIGGSTATQFSLLPSAAASNQHLLRSFCYIADLGSYVVEVVAAGGTINGSRMGITQSLYSELVPSPTLSASAMMKQCDADQWCLGFTTGANEEQTEVGLAFLRTRPLDTAIGQDAVHSVVRLVHWRRAAGVLSGQQACSAVVSEATYLAVYVASANVAVTILVDGVAVTSCTPDAFSCGAMTRCAALNVMNAGAQVDVVVTSIDTSSPFCAHAELNVIFDSSPTFTFGAAQNVMPNLQATANAYTSKVISNGYIATSPLYRKLVLSSSTSSTFYTYVQNMISLEAFVQQNSFGGSTTNITTSAITFSPVGTVTLMSNFTGCGGVSGFFNISSGASDRCDLNARCPQPIFNVSGQSSTGFTGYVQITVDWSVVAKGYTGTWKCGNPATTTSEVILHLVGTPAASSSYGWVGAGDGDLAVYPVYMAPNTSSYLPSGALPLSATITYGTLATAPNTTITSLYSLPRSYQNFSGDEMMACVVDSFGVADRTCVFPIPSASVYVTLTFEDANLATNPISYEILYTDTGEVAWSGTCGGTTGFVDGATTDSNCGTYRTCFVSLTEWMDTNASNAYATRLVVTVPPAVGTKTPCSPFAFSAAAQFRTTYPDGVGSDCNHFTCKLSGECVYLDSVCDGTLDCSDGSDEANCYNWYDVEYNTTLTYTVTLNSSDPSVIPDDFTIESDDDCLALAMRNRSTAYAFSDTTNVCLVYGFSSSSLKGAGFDFSSHRINTDGFVVWTVLQSPLQYTTCSNRLTCQENGVAGKLSNSGLCACACNDPYTGNTCTDFQQLSTDFSEVYLLFQAAVNSVAASQLSADQVSAGLKRWQPTGVFSCDAPIRLNASILSVICQDSAGALTEASVNNQTALSTFNAKLALVGQGGLMAVAMAPTSIPKFSSSGSSCSLDDSGNFTCELVAPLPISMINTAVTLQDPSTTGSLYVNVTFQSATRRRSGVAMHSVAVQCPDSSSARSVGKDKNVKLTCLLDVSSINPNGEAVVGYSIVVLDTNGNTVALTNGGSGASQASYVRVLEIPVLITPADPATVEEDFSVFQWVAIGLIAFGIALMGLIISLCCIHRKHVKRVTNAAIRSENASTLIKVISGLFARMTKIDAFDEHEDQAHEIRDADDLIVRHASENAMTDLSKTVTINNVQRTLCCVKLNKRKYAFLCSSFWICAWILGVFFVLYFVTSSAISSDTWMVAERYADSSCQNSTLAPTPQAIFYIADNTATECQRRQIAGNVTINFYFSGWCFKNATGDNVLAKYRTGQSKAECEGTSYVEVDSDSCISSAGIWGLSSDVTFTRIVCGTTDTTVDRFDYLLTLATETEPSVDSNVVQTTPSKIGTQVSAARFNIIGVRQASTFRSTASAAGVYENYAVGTTPAPLLGKQLYIQQVDELFNVKTAPFYSPLTAALESTYEPIVPTLVSAASSAVPSGLAPYLPPYSSSSLPIGQVYGRFNSSSAVIDSNAGPTATKYYGMHRTLADVGAYLDTSTMQEGQGFTIVFMLKASRETHGFAFAMTDVFEDNAKGQSPILNLMLNIIQRNADGDYWFTEDYHIYHSLLVDGPGQQLQFIYASPATVLGAASNRVYRGLPHLPFPTGRWPWSATAVYLRIPCHGARGCIQSTGTSKLQGKSMSVLTWDLATLGLLRVFNGLWHQVRIVIRMETGTLKAQLIVDGQTSRSTFGWNQCMSNSIPQSVVFPANADVQVYARSQSVGTGSMLWTGYFNGGLGNLGYMPVVEDIFDIWKTSSPAVQSFNDIGPLRYLILGWVMFGLAAIAFSYLSITSIVALYQSSKRSTRDSITSMYERYRSIMSSAAAAEDGSRYRTVKFVTALRWLDVNVVQLGQLLDELQQSTSHVPEELIRLLFVSGQALLDQRKFKDIKAAMPDVQTWENLIDKDEEKYIADHTWDVLCYQKAGQPEEELVKVDLSTSMNSSAVETQTPQRPSSQQRAQTPVGGEYAHDQGAQMQAVQGVTTAGQRGQANVHQNSVGEVNTSNMNVGGGGGNNALSLGTSTSAGFDLDIKQLFFPMVSVVQSVYLWISSSNFIGDYLTYFGEAFSFISIDFVTTFQLPTLVTPLVQLLAGLVAFFVLLYLTAMDEMRFSWYVARYVLRRDSEEHANLDASGTVTGRTDYCAGILRLYHNPYGLIKEFPIKYEVEVLPVKEAMRVDRFVGISSVDDEEDENALAGVDNLTVKDAQGRTFELVRGEDAKKLKGHDQAKKLQVSSTSENTKVNDHMETVGVFCREHKGRRLSPQIQTDVWPFMYPPKCCVVINGERCNAAQGTIFSCQCPIDTEEGSVCLCDYAVCERHYRGGLKDGIYAEVLAVFRQADQRGLQWVVATIAMLGANAAYMPFVKTAIMILACHPVYQCEFTQCHNFTNQKYLIAFYLSLCVVVLFGLGLPLLQVLQLRRRRNLLFHAFFAEEYHGRYEERDSDEHDARTVQQRLQLREHFSQTSSFEGSIRAASASRRGRTPATSRPPPMDLEGTTPARGTDDLFNASSSRLARLESSTSRVADRPPRTIPVDRGVASLDAVTPQVLKEIHDYVSSPPAVVRVLRAVALVLGEPCTEWTDLVAMTQAPDFVARMRALSPSTVVAPNLVQLNEFFAAPDNTVAAIRNESATAGCFIVWLKSVVDAASTQAQVPPSGPSSPLLPQEDAPAAQVATPAANAFDLPQQPEEDIPVQVVEGYNFANANGPPILGLDARPVTPELGSESSDDELEKLDDHVITSNRGRVLRTQEWDRFLASDPTVLGTLYKSLAFNWIYLSPILLLWKVVLICPAVFLPFETFEQLVGICATEVAFAVFIFGTAPFTSPIVDVMYRMGSIHQMLFLGFRSFDIRARFLGITGYAFPMVLLTFAYLGFSVLCIFWTMVGPQIRKVWDKRRSTNTLEELGYQYTLTTSLYVVPSVDAVRTSVIDVNMGEDISPLLNTVVGDLAVKP
ncbi:low density lipoprotein receptor family protein, putative [Bodo saltans]|uniref:Low density lipoprotein receptor family protein, putative n=1 Tax=Bodo saltans TaxID=75058 RepID=A0A0S4J3T1_BODSA|nr:low density lipoprotein receptor family protein, putative [Bodo saltans]|eukprot:CUG61578.1 low density lipoprotein receptor family protein, putative [Bodo saltans]